MRGNYRDDMIMTNSAALDAPDPRKGARLAEPMPKPRWYHKLFSFIPSNRRRIDEYAQYERERAAKDAETAALQQE